MIDYSLIVKSIDYYEANNFKRIETPWMVSKSVDEITKPTNRTSFELIHNKKCLVASGEQSFLYLYLKDFLPKGRFQTVTPCFRDEEFDFLHSKYFIKNELIITDSVNNIELEKLVDCCLGFYSNYFSDNVLNIQRTEDGFDICTGNYELGSYGIRECEFLKWIYGTGCAEPRLSKLINLYNS